MNNFEYLRDQIKYSGFGDHLEKDLKHHIDLGKPDFQLKYDVEFGNDKVHANLNFSKSKQTDLYFFNSYQLKVQNSDNSPAVQQQFYINKSNNITLKEAYNLIQGRSVHKNLTNKEGEGYHAWLQMDFKQSDDQGNFKLKQYHENYGYNLETELSRHAIKELSNETYKNNLIDSLKKGNIQSATIVRDGVEEKVSIEANPQYKTVNVIATSVKVIDQEVKQGFDAPKVAQTSPSTKKQTRESEQNTPDQNARKRTRKQGI